VSHPSTANLHSAAILSATHVAPGRSPQRCLRAVVQGKFVFLLFLALALWGWPLPYSLRAQEEHKKVPVIDKLESSATQQAFMGVVKSVDFESEVLNIDNITGKSTEIFPIKKKVHVVTADGDKLKLGTLKPGTNVMVYFDQKGDRRTITRIVVLTGGPPKKKTPPS